MCTHRIASMRSFWLEHTACLHVEESRKDGLSMSLGMVPWLALVGSRCPWHGHFFHGSEGASHLGSAVYDFVSKLLEYFMTHSIPTLSKLD